MLLTPLSSHRPNHPPNSYPKLIKFHQFAIPHTQSQSQSHPIQVVIANAMEFLVKPREVLRDAWRCLKPGGKVIVSFAKNKVNEDRQIKVGMCVYYMYVYVCIYRSINPPLLQI